MAEKRKIGNSLEVTPVGLGCMGFSHAYGAPTARKEAVRMIHRAYDIRSILNGTLNYYSAVTENLSVQVNGDTATMTGKSRVNAAVFGGGKHTWRLQLFFHAKKTEDRWKLTRAEASTW